MLARLAIISPLPGQHVPEGSLFLQVDLQVAAAADVPKVQEASLCYYFDHVQAAKLCTDGIDFPYLPLAANPGLHTLSVWLQSGGGTGDVLSATQEVSFKVLAPKLSPEPFLFETRPPQEDRFTPTGMMQIRTSIYLFWNILDRIMQAEVGKSYTPMYGYMRRSQLDYLVETLASGEFQSYCEVGFNGGHSAVAALLSNPDAIVHSFDIGQLGYSKPAAQLLTTAFPGRFHIHWGNSVETIPHFVTQSPEQKCGLLLIDGGHDRDTVLADIANFETAAACRNSVMLDDSWPIGEGDGLGVGAGGPGDAVRLAVERGLLVKAYTHKHATVTEASPPLRWGNGFTTWVDTRWGWTSAEYRPRAGCGGGRGEL
jgi:hypothetical protein